MAIRNAKVFPTRTPASAARRIESGTVASAIFSISGLNASPSAAAMITMAIAMNVRTKVTAAGVIQIDRCSQISLRIRAY